MPSSKKKQKGKAKKGNTASTSSVGAAASTVKPPRSNDEIVGGRTDPNRPPKKAVVRELYDALMYEVNSDSRAELIAKVAALDDDTNNYDETKEIIAEKEKTDTELIMPVTYETKAMLDYPGKCMLTVGRNAPFKVAEVYHNRPTKLIQQWQNDNDEKLTHAMRWTGEDPTIHILFPQLKLCGRESIVFLGECYLDKEDVAHFAGRFAKGSGGSIYDWPNSNAILQCPFTCTMAVPDRVKTTEPKRYIMILQNIKQFAVINGGLHMPHRGLPRLCDKEYFEKNLRGGLDFSNDESAVELPPSADWCQYPQILEEGIVFRAARKVLPSRHRTEKLVTSSDNYLPSAYSLFSFYHECGMCAAVSQVNDDKQSQMMRKLRG